MDFTLELIFVGLIAFVQHQSDAKMTVLLVEGQQGYTAISNPGTISIPPHYPLMYYRCEDRPSGCLADERASDVLALLDATWGIPKITSPGVVPLRRVEIEVDGDFSVEPRLRFLNSLRQRHFDSTPKMRIPDTKGENRDTSWLADMRKIAPSAAKISPACTGSVAPPQALVVARGVFKNGEVSSERLLFDGAIPFAFKPIREDERRDAEIGQALADRVALRIRVRGCRAIIRLRAYDGQQAGQVVKEIELVPPDCGNPAARVTVYVSNRMRCSDWDLSAPQSPRCKDSHVLHDAGQHFERFYLLSTNVLPELNRPVPYGLIDLPTGDGDDRPICPKPMFIDR